MASLALFVFLLEELPGFEEIFNSTFHDISNDVFNNATVSLCNPVLGEMIWQNINRKNLKSNNQLKYEDNYVDSLVPDDISATISEKIVSDYEEGNNYINSTFLVAIFESVLNLTAQTCGGTLVSPRWVLTAVTCVDLLSHLYKKNNNSTILDSHYSIIANAINPLVDGTVHNVTDILFHPTRHLNFETTESPLDIRSGIKIPSLALLRIEPPVNNYIEIISEKIRPGLEVFIYTWVLIKNSSNQDIMTVTNFEAITLETNACKVNYSFIEDDSLICLSVSHSNDLKTHLTNSGGPVVVSVKKKLLMAAVAQLDTNSNFVGYLLHSYYSWIQEVISK